MGYVPFTKSKTAQLFILSINPLNLLTMSKLAKLQAQKKAEQAKAKSAEQTTDNGNFSTYAKDLANKATDAATAREYVAKAKEAGKFVTRGCPLDEGEYQVTFTGEFFPGLSRNGNAFLMAGCIYTDESTNEEIDFRLIINENNIDDAEAMAMALIAVEESANEPGVNYPRILEVAEAA